MGPLCCLVVTLAALVTPARALAATRIVIQAVDTSEPNVSLQVTLRLRDITGSYVTALRPYDVQVSIEGGEGTTARFAPGAAEASAVVTPHQLGIVEIHATHPELLPGSWHVRIEPRHARAGGFSGLLEALGRRRPDRLLSATVFPSANAWQPPPVATVAQAATLQMRASPKEGIPATGSEPATIEMWIAPPLPAPLTLHLAHTAGSLKPEGITIPAGGHFATATLTSSVPQSIKVEWPGSPELSGANVSVEFVPAVAALTVQVEPTPITVLDRGEIVVTLLDHQQPPKPIATHRDRDVTLVVRKGRANLHDTTETISKGHFDQRFAFTPTDWGLLTIEARTDELDSVTNEMRVQFPLKLLVLSLSGGGLGGILFTYGRSWRRKRIVVRALVGMVAGAFTYFWAAQIGVAPARLVSPVSAILVAAVGGWVGTKVFTWAARQFGIDVEGREHPDTAGASLAAR